MLFTVIERFHCSDMARPYCRSAPPLPTAVGLSRAALLADDRMLGDPLVARPTAGARWRPRTTVSRSAKGMILAASRREISSIVGNVTAPVSKGLGASPPVGPR